jgi:hypothetical protein
MAVGSSKTSAHLPEYMGHIPKDTHFYVISVKMSNTIFETPAHSAVLQHLNITSTKVNKKTLNKGGDNKIQLRIIPKCFQTRT